MPTFTYNSAPVYMNDTWYDTGTVLTNVTLGLHETEIDIDERVKATGSFAFKDCTNLVSVNFSRCTALSIIGESTFVWCTALVSVNFSHCTALTHIGKSAFCECTALTSVNFSYCTALTYIGKRAFIRCTALTSVNFSYCTALTHIGKRAFTRCTALVSVDFSYCTALTHINEAAFWRCTALATLDFSHCTMLTYIGEWALTSIALNTIYLPINCPLALYQICYDALFSYRYDPLYATDPAYNDLQRFIVVQNSMEVKRICEQLPQLSKTVVTHEWHQRWLAHKYQRLLYITRSPSHITPIINQRRLTGMPFPHQPQGVWHDQTIPLPGFGWKSADGAAVAAPQPAHSSWPAAAPSTHPEAANMPSEELSQLPPPTEQTDPDLEQPSFDTMLTPTEPATPLPPALPDIFPSFPWKGASFARW